MGVGVGAITLLIFQEINPILDENRCIPHLEGTIVKQVHLI